MEAAIITELAMAGVVVVVSAFIGVRAQGTFGGLLLGMGAILASALCVGGTWVGLALRGPAGGWAGLAAGVVVSGLLAWVAASRLVRGRSGRFVALLWYTFCAFSVFAYLAGGPLGLFTITLPAVAVFWIGLFRVSAYLLPRRDEDQRPVIRLWRERKPSQGGASGSSSPSGTPQRPVFVLFPLPGLGRRINQYVEYWRQSQWRGVFRSLLSYSMGTNYPFYVLRHGKAELRVKGNAYGQFFAGPGVVFAECDHAGYLTDGIRVKGVLEPGLNFTGMFDLAPKVVDLRPQLCSFQVEAVTGDGIPVRVQAHVPFQTRTVKGPVKPPDRQPGVPAAGGQSVPYGPELGRPFPFRRRAVYALARLEPVQRGETKESSGQRHGWDTQLIPILTTRILQDIIGRYSVDSLCDPDRKARVAPPVEIVEKMNRRLEDALPAYGLELVKDCEPAPDGPGKGDYDRPRRLERSGGWIGNLIPLDETVVQRRQDNWRTEWERRILLLMGEGKAERAREIEKARADAELSILRRFGQLVRNKSLSDPASQTALALRFIDCMGEVLSEAETQWQLPESMSGTLQRLRGQIEEGQR